jgi:enoyl-CoA hydratase
MSDEIIIEELSGENGLVGRITLNRPQALNALTENMCHKIFEALQKWSDNPNIKLVIAKGAGEKAFCAGGDIKKVYENRDHPISDFHPFFSAEYKMNAFLHHFKKPYFALLNGITMGGGVGVSLHGSHRIATDKFRLAMPETAIGFYPDVGVGYYLARLPKKIGWYLGLTGNAIGPADALYLGLCTHYIEGEKIPALEEALISSGDEKVILNFALHDLIPEIKQHENTIEYAFSRNLLEEAIQALENEGGSFSRSVLDILNLRSPMSLKITWEHLKHCETLSFDEIMQENFRLTQHCLKGQDFYEGVRAQVIDKDKTPKWKPANLNEITEIQVAQYFQKK